MISDASAIDAAICNYLASDAALMAAMPDGVWFDVAAPGTQQFVIVALLDSGAEPLFQQGTAWEIYTYLIKAVSLGTSGQAVKTAAARIHELMQRAVINAPGYTDMKCTRIERIRYTEVDESSDIRWQHRGGHYELWMIPTEA